MADAATANVDVLDAAQKVGQRSVLAVTQSHSNALDGACALAQTLSAGSSHLYEAGCAPGLPDVAAITARGFDVAVELLTARRDFAATIANTLALAQVN